MAEQEEPDTAAFAFYRKLLSWNYFAVMMRTDDGAGAVAELKKVPNTFANAQEYIDTFAPLILEESGALLLRGNEETDVFESQRCLTGHSSQKDGFLVVQVLMDAGVARNFGANDIVLVTKDDPRKEEGVREQLNALGAVDHFAGDQSLSIRFCLREEEHSGDASEVQRIRAMLSGLRVPNTGFYVNRLASVSTLVREWNALHAVGKVNFKEILFLAKPKPSPSPQTTLKTPQAMEEEMAKEYNASQMKAVSGGLSGQEVVLIQGPPGTGKTKTLLGLLSIVLHAAPEGSLGLKTYTAPKTQRLTGDDKYRLWLKASPWVAGLPNPRDLVEPWDEGSVADVFGMLEVAKPVVIGRESPPKAHVLVCAPSNSALDEIVIRLMDVGVMDRKGQRYAPSIVRVGLQIHHSVQSVSLDHLVDQRLAKQQSAKGSSGPNKAMRERLKLAILEDAHIVCSTLAFSGSPLLSRLSRPFDVVVIDEAAQAVEPSTLIPLCTGAQQVFLIGDPVQLPATVISKRAVSFNYDVSLFKRLQTAGYPVHVLDTQYRMHPSISAFPSSEFYFGNLKNGPGLAELMTRPWQGHRCLGPFAFYDVNGAEQVPDNSSSLVNKTEAEMVMSLFLALVQRYPQLRASSSIAVISPYKAQVKLLRNQFRQALGEDNARHVDINTIDGFQGREKEVAIFSAVRSSKGGRIGFVADERRINVGLTRARCSLLIVGNAFALQTDPHWHNLLRHARVTKAFYKSGKQPFSDYLGKVMAGDFVPEGPTAQDLQELAEEEPQAESHVLEDDDAFSDDEPPPERKPSKAEKAAAEAQKRVKPAGNTAPPTKRRRKGKK